jgi:hypothetical protein
VNSFYVYEENGATSMPCDFSVKSAVGRYISIIIYALWMGHAYYMGVASPLREAHRSRKSSERPPVDWSHSIKVIIWFLWPLNLDVFPPFFVRNIAP